MDYRHCSLPFKTEHFISAVKKKKKTAAVPTIRTRQPLEYAVRRVQVKLGGLKLSGTHQLLVYADDVNILGGRVHTVKKNTEALVAAIKEIGLEVNSDKNNFFWLGAIPLCFINIIVYQSVYKHNNDDGYTQPKHVAILKIDYCHFMIKIVVFID